MLPSEQANLPVTKVPGRGREGGELVAALLEEIFLVLDLPDLPERLGEDNAVGKNIPESAIAAAMGRPAFARRDIFIRVLEGFFNG